MFNSISTYLFIVFFVVAVYFVTAKFFRLKKVRQSLEAQIKKGIAELNRKNQDLEDTKKTLLNVFEDLTVANKKIREEKARDEATLLSIGDGLITTDEEGRIVLVNAVFEELLGWKESEIQGKLLTDVVPMIDERGKDIPLSERPINIIQKKRLKATTTTTSSYKHKNGTSFPVVITISPIFLNKEFVGAVEVFRDITKEKEVDKEKTEFISLTSHQLRTPLTTISWYIEMILHGDVGKVVPGQKDYLQKIYQGNQRMIELVNILLNVSRMELGTFVVQLKETDVVALAEDVLDEQKKTIEKKNLTVVQQFNKNIGTISADPTLLRIVFQNLLSNAVAYTPQDGRIELSISLNDADTMLIQVTDTGYGIPKKQQDKIFTKLFRADNVRAKDTDGTGLGLYLTKAIVEHSGGKIWFESEENKGTTFYVSLPR